MTKQRALWALLENRAILRVSGEDSGGFLQGLMTNDIDTLTEQTAIYSALLSPQGKIITDFIVFKTPEAFLIDLPSAQADVLLKKLKLYRLRAKVDLEDMSKSLSVIALWSPNASRQVVPDPVPGTLAFTSDPRLPDLGWRCLISVHTLNSNSLTTAEQSSETNYNCHRIRLGVPEAGHDYPFASVYPHDAMVDQLHGVSFTKGCYVGQEVVSRVRHRDGARKRCLMIRSEKALPQSGSDIKSGSVTLGQLGSTCNTAGLAIVRIDRLQELSAKGDHLTCDGQPIEAAKPVWATFTFATSTT
jgi:tRNA-modifying protein YgfZ